MSAAAVRALPPPAPILRKPAVCKIPDTVIDRMMLTTIDTERKIMWMVANGVSKLGANGKVRFATKEFSDGTIKSKKWAAVCAANLEARGDLGSSAIDGHHLKREYWFPKTLTGESQQRQEAPEICEECGRIGVFKTPPFTPVVRKGVENVMAATTPTAWSVFVWMCRRSGIGAWNGETFQAQWFRAERQQIEDDVNHCERAISEAIADLEDLTAVTRFDVPGQGSWYRICPENWDKITARRGLRIVKQPPQKARTQRPAPAPVPDPIPEDEPEAAALPEPVKPAALSDPVKPSKNSDPKPKESTVPLANESHPGTYKYCPNCCKNTRVRPLTAEELKKAEVERPPRAGPMRETGVRKSKRMALFDRIEAKCASQ
jgi:hypothetical protein